MNSKEKDKWMLEKWLQLATNELAQTKKNFQAINEAKERAENELKQTGNVKLKATWEIDTLKRDVQMLEKSNIMLMNEIHMMKRWELNILNNTDPDELPEFDPNIVQENESKDPWVPKLNLTKIFHWREREYMASLLRKKGQEEVKESDSSHRLVADEPSSLQSVNKQHCFSGSTWNSRGTSFRKKQMLLNQRKEEIVNMLNTTFVDDPDAADSRQESSPGIINDTVDKKKEDSDFIGEWMWVQEQSKRLNPDGNSPDPAISENNRKDVSRGLMPVASFDHFDLDEKRQSL